MTQQDKERIVNKLLLEIDDKAYSINRKLIKHIGRILLKNRDVAIIANNCCGADICHTYGLRFNSPTVNLQILPCDFSKFCVNLKYYLDQDIVQIPNVSSELSELQQENIRKVFGGRTIEDLTGIPFGKCGDVIIVFQHYKTFDEAKEKWNARKVRVNIDNCAFLLVVGPDELKEARQFDLSDLGIKKNKLIITKNCKYLPISKTTEAISTGRIPEGEHFMARHNLFLKHYEVNFNPIKWLNSLPIDKSN